MSESVVVPVGDLHDVVVGRGVLERVTAMVPAGARQVLLVRPEKLERYSSSVAAALAEAGYLVHDAPVPDAEAAKTAQVASGLWSLLGRHAFTRTDVVVAVGGGTVTDLAGFVAATWLRGVPVVQVPTTLLAMVDAAVGGKTGINIPEGKNLVGAFHIPAGVVCDLDVLETLPRVDLVAGLAEVVKGGFIADPGILELVEADPDAATDWASPVLAELVERKVRVKAEVVAADLREAFGREVLNYGHTLGHAVEQVSGYRRRHGEAVAVGMVFAAELGHRAGGVDDALLTRHRAVLEAVGLPTTYDEVPFGRLLPVMARDKKSRGATLRFVVLDGLAHPVRLEGPDEAVLRAAYAALAP
ncbi:3-dehydroquinate synthase [Phycicoccus endophyticus]|uniref:3-dehydroquinate synthase n=1 Tax=Phycicoccus endophyticus TaxID=1690220 RepID=A0A7G9R478_9MICO|nr:3-dehydroquinate synthase [Phycicoccus endophyticus]NHI18256.1 3-dehydroquinate synthase [Phycicoccus endophyticus]QNN50403.1 3-dehydroquinate synthase [Phycicoccus endophyticus]GGL25179.1 3-dehydroquinate synthase [Phycicoccus endophyticus]